MDSVFFSSSSLSELLEEELSDATSGAFLATQTLHTHAVDINRKETVCKIDAWLSEKITCHKVNQLTDRDVRGLVI